MDFSNSPSSSISNNNSLPKLMNAITSCCDAISSAFDVTFDKVSGFASNVWAGVKTGWIFVDVILRNLILLSRHMSDLARELGNWMKFAVEELVSMLYDVEAKIMWYLIENNFFRENFGWLAEGIVSLIKNIRYNLVLA